METTLAAVATNENLPFGSQGKIIYNFSPNILEEFYKNRNTARTFRGACQ